MFFREWLKSRSITRCLATEEGLGLRPGALDYLKTAQWVTYCSEHRGAVEYLCTNLQFSKQGFVDVYGLEEGAQLWDLYCKLSVEVAQERGLPMYSAENPSGFRPEGVSAPNSGEHFVPLWKRRGIPAEKVKPFNDPIEVEQYHHKRREGKLADYDGIVPLPPGRSTPYGPQTTADMIHTFVSTYQSFFDNTGFAAAVMAFQESAVKRMGIKEDKYEQIVVPIVSKLILTEAIVHDDVPGFMAQAEDNLFKALSDLIPADSTEEDRMKREQKFRRLAQRGVQGAVEQQELIQRMGPQSRENAFGWLIENIQEELQEARDLKVGSWSQHVRNNNAPSTVIHVANGMHYSPEWNNDLITWRILGTGFDVSELERNY